MQEMKPYPEFQPPPPLVRSLGDFSLPERLSERRRRLKFRLLKPIGNPTESSYFVYKINPLITDTR